MTFTAPGLAKALLGPALWCLASGAWAAGGSEPAANPASARQGGGFVDWLAPPLPTPRPQTEEEKQAGRERGRTPPEPELLQPRLDPALPRYEPDQRRPLKGELRGASSDVLVGLVELWRNRFMALHPQVKLAVSPPYAGSLGAKELIRQSVDLVFVSRELKPEDVSEFRARFGYAPSSVPIAGGSYRQYGFLDAMGFFVHRDNPIERLDLDQIDAIFSSTQHRGAAPIRTWGQLGLTGEWADKAIQAHGVQPWNGFEEFIRQRILSVGDKRGEWRTDMHFEKVVFPLASKVAMDRYAIGYSGIAYIDAPVKMLPIAMSRAGEAIAPTYENVALARYPLSRLIYLNLNKQPGKPVDPVLAEFLRYVLSREGQQAVLDHGIFLPLREEQAASSRLHLDP